VTPRHPDTDGPIAGFAALPSDERMAEMIRSADLSMRDQWGRHRSRTSYYWRDMGHAVAVLLRNHLPLVEALRGLRLPAEPEAPTPANDCAGYGFGICPCGCHDQPVPTPEPPAEPRNGNYVPADLTDILHKPVPASVPEAAPGHHFDPFCGECVKAMRRTVSPGGVPEAAPDDDEELGDYAVRNPGWVEQRSVPEAAPGLREALERIVFIVNSPAGGWEDTVEHVHAVARAALDATPSPALDAPRHPDDTPCEHLIPARECRIVGCRGASTDTPEAER
jgi:hypothetical protein